MFKEAGYLNWRNCFQTAILLSGRLNDITDWRIYDFNRGEIEYKYVYRGDNFRIIVLRLDFIKPIDIAKLFLKNL